MTQQGSGSGVPSSDFTYDLGNPNNQIKWRSQIRLAIGDTIPDNGPRPGNQNFLDIELDTMMGAEGNHIQRSTAKALETLASEWAKTAARQSLGPASSEQKQADTYLKLAKALRDTYGHTTATGANASATSAILSWADYYSTRNI